MIRKLDFTQSSRIESSMLPRPELNSEGVEDAVAEIIAQVRVRGSEAVIEFGQTFDGVEASSLRVPSDIIDSAVEDLDPEIRSALELAIERVRKVHSGQLPTGFSTELGPGAVVETKYIPVDRVGLYVPGGSAVYPSSVVMNVVPAQLAQVGSIAIASPAQVDNNGWPASEILAAAGILGIDEVYATGGAQAIAWLALGSSGVDAQYQGEVGTPVKVITGPGNVWVTTAKRQLQGEVGIDSEAGPTEIMVIADESANPKFVAADLISQAEHDELASSVLVTDSVLLAKAVEVELESQVEATKHASRVKVALAGTQSAIILVRNIDQAIEVANEYAAEHLEIQTQNPKAVAQQIRNAGAVFIGSFSPVSLGDYCAGSNHVLPTMGCACHSSGLNVGHFLKSVQFIDYDADALDEVAKSVVALARAEDLPAHAQAIEVRSESNAGLPNDD